MPLTPERNDEAAVLPNPHRDKVEAAQIRLLYRNADTGTLVTIIAVSALGWLQWASIAHIVLLLWALYMLLVLSGRAVLVRRYWHTDHFSTGMNRWGNAFAIGAGLAGAGWGTAGILLYPEGQLIDQVVLLFLLGGMMLGGASLLAPRAQAFLPFLVPTGLLPTIRLLWHGDQQHLIMGTLAAVFTMATLRTTWQFYRAIESSLALQFTNDDLMKDLQTAKNEAEALNQQLEVRVQERTAELQKSSERLQHEIDEREKLEHDLLRVRNLESLGTLAGGIAHDFNNLLTIIQGNIELAKMQLAEDATVQEILDQTTIACERAKTLSAQLVTFAKGGAPMRRVVSVAKLISKAVDLACAGAAVRIGVDIPEGLAAAEVDADQMGQVLHNILLNAKQSMPEGGLIEVRAKNVVLDKDMPGFTRYVRISIKDHGCGISPTVLPRIFDPYFTTKSSGTGLGLTTAYAIISKHGGRISVDSQNGAGAEFIIDLPAAECDPAPEPEVASSVHMGAGRILVMDDEEALRKLMYRILSRLGYEVQTASEGAEAVELFQKAKASGCDFDAVVLDLTVSNGMGGVEAARRLKELVPSAKLVVSSGYSEAPVMSNFAEYGFDGVLPKPWALSQISEFFQNFLGQKMDMGCRTDGGSD